MEDDWNSPAPADAARVNIHEEDEVRYWCGELGCSAAELRRAVAASGVSTHAVRAWLVR